jgi:hypothetical protein
LCRDLTRAVGGYAEIPAEMEGSILRFSTQPEKIYEII